MKYSALIFDMDGTLVDNMAFHKMALEQTMREAGILLPANMDEFHRSVYGKKTVEVFRSLLGPLAPDAEVNELANRKEALYRDLYIRARKPLDGLEPLLEYASEREVPMAVASAAPPDNIRFILDGLGLRHYFKRVISGQDVQRGKPHPDIFLKAAQSMGIEPSGCLVFEDGLNGIEAARRAGMDAVLISTSLDAKAVAREPHVQYAVADFTRLNLRPLLG